MHVWALVRISSSFGGLEAHAGCEELRASLRDGLVRNVTVERTGACFMLLANACIEISHTAWYRNYFRNFGHVHTHIIITQRLLTAEFHEYLHTVMPLVLATLTCHLYLQH
jgi:hypothetical protein